MHLPVPTLAAATLLCLAACSGEGAEEAAGNVAAGMAQDEGAPDGPAIAPEPATSAAQPSDDDSGGGNEAAAEESAAIIPERFHGEWNSDRSACGSGSNATRLRISGDRLQFYESVGLARRVEVEGERVIEVTAQYAGEGESWQDERRLSLSEDGDSLTISGSGSSLVRHRCP